MATTLNLISKQTLGVNTSSVTFSNIPQTYTDLRVVVSTRIDNANGGMFVRLNNSSTNYSSRRLYADSGSMGSDAGSSSSFFMWTTGTWATSSTFGSNSIYIPNYTSSNYKSVEINSVNENNSSSPWAMGLVNGLWSDTSAVTSIVFIPEGAGTPNFVSGSTFYLYGIDKSTTQNTSVPKALGGDTITTNGTYWYHTFLSSGTFKPLTSLTCDYLVVAGGGGGGGDYRAGGGGAGGLRSTVTATGGGGSLESALSLTAQNYTVTVGAGGAGVLNDNGTQGSNSVFGSITSTGGGYGGGKWEQTPVRAGGNGGSGGGGIGDSTRTAAGGSGTANQGYAGGSGYNGNLQCGGGGGGAGGVGQNGGSGGTDGDGGPGVSVSITGSSITYAGGGGGGNYGSGNVTIGGTGGGGAGGSGDSPYKNGTAGTANLGAGGGGASGLGYSGGSGGSGIVVVRYAV